LEVSNALAALTALTATIVDIVFIANTPVFNFQYGWR
jgi:hypothetical protein